MNAVEISSPGAPEVLKLTTRPLPELRSGEVLIRVAAAGINGPDLVQRRGGYPPPPGASDLPGLEIAGTVVAVSGESGAIRVGDAVCALVTGGGYAEYCAASASLCLPVPRGLSLEQAASLPETYFTVWSNVFDRGRLAAGETLLVQGGASGIGVAAIQTAAAFGNRVFATAGSAEKCQACEQLGAQQAINYRTEDFVEVVKRLTDNKGVDVILDMVAGDYIAREIKALAPDGRLVIIALLGGAKGNADFSAVMLKRLTVTGSTLRARSVEFKAAIAENLRTRIWPLIESGRIKPVIHARFALAEAARAHALMESGAHIGKLMLVLP
ncbi:NAD(P)H-quinone oxidoreductase [Hydrocarboniphaga sp.]|uniref:NAD(P)H-quinone oxidoreductase n=1 Tax=Hydrocarboniphaga sp. TaxID=2033016 RepID=UPI003451131F